MIAIMRVIRFSKRQKIIIGAIILCTIIIAFKVVSNFHTDQPQQVLADQSLTYSEGSFFLNGEKIRIFSGAMHYFRVVPEYWLDRLEKMRAAGLNTVET